MIEPAAYGAAVIFGPLVWNFRDTADRLVTAQAAIQIGTVGDLETTLRSLLQNPEHRTELGQNARALVVQQKGATVRTMDCLDQLLAVTLKQAA
jgi:3-deoxy-D-manno-octulosonic-acid transferase